MAEAATEPTRRDERAARRPRRGRDVLVVAVGLAVGVAGSVFADDVRDLLDRDDSAPAVAPAVAASVEDADVVALPVESGGDDRGTPAATPREAVTQFLGAEVAGDHERSFGLLPAGDRTAHGTPAAWAAAHASYFPIRSFTVLDVVGEAVRTELRFRPSLDEVVGLVPARATATWPVRREGGGWVVDHGAVDLEPRYAPDAGAARAVRAWALGRQACADVEEYGAGLVGRAPLADDLCGTSGRISTGPVQRLDPADAAPFTSAFGAGAPSWARTVRVSGPVDLIAVVAPVGARWLVVGVVEPADA